MSNERDLLDDLAKVVNLAQEVDAIGGSLEDAICSLEDIVDAVRRNNAIAARWPYSLGSASHITSVDGSVASPIISPVIANRHLTLPEAVELLYDENPVSRLLINKTGGEDGAWPKWRSFRGGLIFEPETAPDGQLAPVFPVYLSVKPWVGLEDDLFVCTAIHVEGYLVTACVQLGVNDENILIDLEYETMPNGTDMITTCDVNLTGGWEKRFNRKVRIGPENPAKHSASTSSFVFFEDRES